MIFLSKRMEIALKERCIVFGKVILYPKDKVSYVVYLWSQLILVIIGCLLHVVCCVSTPTASEDRMKTLI